MEILYKEYNLHKFLDFSLLLFFKYCTVIEYPIGIFMNSYLNLKLMNILFRHLFFILENR